MPARQKNYLMAWAVMVGHDLNWQLGQSRIHQAQCPTPLQKVWRGVLASSPLMQVIDSHKLALRLDARHQQAQLFTLGILGIQRGDDLALVHHGDPVGQRHDFI